MSFLEGVLGGVVGAEMVSIVSAVVEKHGGLQGLVSQFEQQGMGNAIKSWVGDGGNQAISPDEVHKVLGSDMVKQMAAKFGISSDEMASKLSTVLPQAIDKMTPEGKVAA